MPLTAGSRLGPYEILAPLGAGGMGEVYMAKDTRLDRMVAIKVLPAHLSERPELRQRLEREARAISSLSHPNICTLHDVGHQDDVDFLVMEHIEGETLADRLVKGALPAEQTLKFGIEIAGALDRAHRQGIVHRDLKPGNIMLTRSGVKLLDFGLAKVTAGVGAGPAPGALSGLPTEGVGSQPLTAEGTLLGTFQYMAPEQLEGREADARTDLFALGAVLYEMVAGRPAFSGKSRASLISSIMSSEPPSIGSLQPLTPPALDRLIKTCLAKDPDERIQTAHDVMLQLQWIAEGGSQLGVPAPVAIRRRRRELLAWVLAVAGLLGVAALALLLWLRRPPEAITTRFAVSAPSAVVQIGLPRISPDGRTLAFDATDSTGRVMMWVRPLNSMVAAPLPGTEGTGRPWWSPDSRFIAFVAGGKLKKIALSGGPAQTLADAPSGYDGSWSRNGLILFDGGANDPLMRVSAAGGVAAAEVRGDSVAVGWPEFLPDGRHYLYVVVGGGTGGEIVVAKIGAKEVRRLGVKGSRVEYSPAGYILFVRDRTLLAQPFDTRKLAVTGEPFPVAEPLSVSGQGFASFSVSDNGTLVYGAGSLSNNKLVWLDRTGKPSGDVGPPGDILVPALSPDEKRIAVRQADAQTANRDVWILEPARGTSTRLTFDPGNDNTPLWSPDGSRIAFVSNRKGHFDLFQKFSSGAGEEESLLVSGNDKFLSDWSRDGRFLAYREFDAKTKSDLWVLPLAGDRKPSVFLKTPFEERLARFSPEGRWIAYTSDESGRDEVYVQAFPPSGGKWQISTRGGSEATWRADARELYYVAPDGKLMSVDVKAGVSFEARVPVPLFDLRATPTGESRYAVARDGQRFLVTTPEASAAVEPAMVVLNWNAGMRSQ